MIPHPTLVGLATHPLKLAGIGATWLATCAVTFSVVESRSLWDSVYWSVVTATTLGEGTIVATTIVGRVAAMMLVASTVIGFIPLITAAILAKVNRDAWQHEEQEALFTKLNAIHADVRNYRIVFTTDEKSDH